MAKWFSYERSKTQHHFYEYADGYLSSCRVYIHPNVDDAETTTDKPHCKRCESIEANGGPVWQRD